eukprot:7353987-Prymnesium_polylepis.1
MAPPLSSVAFSLKEREANFRRLGTLMARASKRHKTAEPSQDIPRRSKIPPVSDQRHGTPSPPPDAAALSRDARGVT